MEPYSQLIKPIVVSNPHSRPYYLKSRTGCLPCKQRKVKCDEKHPLCGNCAKRYPGLTNCRTFNAKAAKKNDQKSGLKTEKSETNVVVVPKTVTIRAHHLQDSAAGEQLEDLLIAHYVNVLQSQMPDHEDTNGRRVWEYEIPQLAFADENVRGAVLSVSAIHLRSLVHDERISRAAGYYFGRTIRKHRENMKKLDSSMAEPLIITAMMLIYYTWQATYDPKITNTYSFPMETFHMEKGFFALIAKLTAHGMGLDKHCQWLLGQTFPPFVDDSVHSTRFFETFRASLYRILEAMPEDFHPEDKQDIMERVAFNIAICHEMCTGASHERVRRAMVMVVSHCSYRHMALLKNRDPIALALFAHGLGLAHVVEHAWWLHGPKQLHLERYHLQGILGLMPPDALWMMKWPLDATANRIPFEVQTEDMYSPTGSTTATPSSITSSL